MTTSTTTKLLCSAAITTALAVAPTIAAAKVDAGYRLGDGLKLTLGSTDSVASSAADLVEAARPRHPTPAASDLGAFMFGGSIGVALASNFTGFPLRLQASYTAAEIQPNLYFDFAGHFGLTFSDNFTIYEILPIARLRYAVSDLLSIYGDSGLGLAFVHTSTNEIIVGGFVIPATSETTTTGILRFSGGVQYTVAPPNLVLTFEPVGLNVYFSGGNTFMYTMLVGILYKT